MIEGFRGLSQTFQAKAALMIYDIFVNCNWVANRLQ